MLIEKLLDAGARVKAYDPAAMDETKKVLGDRIEYASDPYEAIDGADAVALMTEWSEFHLPDFSRMAELMKGKVIFDGRNIYDPDELKKTWDLSISGLEEDRNEIYARLKVKIKTHDSRGQSRRMKCL